MNNKIKIYIFHPFSMLGGADTSLSRLINNLNKNNYEIDFITITKNNLKLKKKIRIIRIDSARTLFSIFQIRMILKQDRDSKFKKYIFLSNQNFANIISFFITFRLHWIKLCLIERNHLDEFKYNKNFKNFIIKILIKFLYKYANKIIGISKKLSLDLKNFSRSNILTIYNPSFDKEIYKLSKEKIFIKKKSSQKIILNVARLERQKDHLTLLRGFKESLKIIDSNLIIIGYGSKKKDIFKFIEENNLESKVKILDKVSNPYPYYKKADLFILTSLYEGFGNVLVEAAMFNIPIISTDCNSGPREILLNGKGGDLIKINNYKDLSEKIVKNLKSKNMVKTKILKKSLDRFSVKQNIDSYTKVFKTI
jgi:glycosyltransferase involved in cell wall biosynthesis